MTNELFILSCQVIERIVGELFKIRCFFFSIYVLFQNLFMWFYLAERRKQIAEQGKFLLI